MPTDTTDAAIVAPELALGERLAADLRVLAQVAAVDFRLAHELARIVEQLHIVLPPHALLTRESIGAALQSYGATAV
ncbi:MAG: hypothetical protein L0I76_26200, partial [Pseudonocardia sp.]|nr:hypothetical protein [Pseudonocardia sp.]